MNPEYRTAADLLRALKSREVSALELTEQAIARIEAQDTRLNAIPVRDFERAHAAAKEADVALAHGEARPLLGLPMTVKESFNIAGLPTTWGIAGTKEIPVWQDAVAVDRLKAAGAVILGKSNIAAMLADWQSANPVYGVSNNPWDVSRTPGGSSGGAAAALAAGFVPLELGSDLAGSLRVPAHFCGVYAHKPSLDLVPTRGHAPPGSPNLSVPLSLDLAVVGPMARSADDLRLALDVLAGPDDALATAYRLELPPPRHAALKDYRVLVLAQHPSQPTGSAVGGVLEALAGRLEQAGCKIGRESPLLPDLAALGRLYGRLFMAFAGAMVPAAQYAELQKQSAKLPPGAAGPEADSLRSMTITHHGWMQAHFARTAIAHQWRQLFREWDIVLCPVMPTPAFHHDARTDEARTIVIDGKPFPYGEQFIWSGLATLTGLPATAFPAGMADGLPVGLQAIGPHLEDRTPIAFAAALEQAFGGFRPPPA